MRKLVFIFAALVAARCACADAQTDLVRECESVLQIPIRRPYGWAIADDVLAGATTKGPIAADLSARATPAVGLALYDAGRKLDRKDFTEAALQLARGLAAAQEKTGRVPSVAIFGVNRPQGRDEPRPIPDRAPTRGALALWLTILADQPADERDTRLSSAATRAAIWLFRQQSSVGGFWQNYPPDAPAAEQEKLLVMDNPEWRDNLIAMMLAVRVLGDGPMRPVQAGVERAADLLVRMRVADALKFGQNLWFTAYTPDGVLREHLPGLEPGPDMLATRYAMQTLLAHTLVTGDQKSLDSLVDAARILTALRDADGTWPRHYFPFGATTRPGPDEDTRLTERNRPTPSDWGLPSVMRSTADLRSGGRDAVISLCKAAGGIDRQFAWTLVELEEFPMATDYPLSKSEAAAWLIAHPAITQEANGPMQPSARQIAGRLRAMLILADLEKKGRPAAAPK